MKSGWLASFNIMRSFQYDAENLPDRPRELLGLRDDDRQISFWTSFPRHAVTKIPVRPSCMVLPELRGKRGRSARAARLREIFIGWVSQLSTSAQRTLPFPGSNLGMEKKPTPLHSPAWTTLNSFPVYPFIYRVPRCTLHTCLRGETIR